VAYAFALSWHAAIRFHGQRPKKKPNQIFVANHTSLIDAIILLQDKIYSFVGQKHSGFVGFCQGYFLKCLNCLWFDRGVATDRKAVATRYSKIDILIYSN
jgi:glycerol-3-phosphate O-acyltransferase 3/4